MSNRRAPPPASTETKINMWLNVAALIIPLLVIVFGGLYAVGNFTATVKEQIAGVSKDVDLKIQPIGSKVDAVSQKVDSAAKDAQSKVDVLSAKIDAGSTLSQSKQDALTTRVDGNIADQQAFRVSVQSLFSKVFDSQQKLADQLNQERVDRLTEAAKKK